MKEKMFGAVIVLAATVFIILAVWLAQTSRFRHVYGGEVDALDTRMTALEARVAELEKKR